MALRILFSSSSPLFLIHHNLNPTRKKTSRRVTMLAQNTPSSLIQIRSSIKLQKVFEDKPRGIVCYLDDSGEITCEGYDEGPRLAVSTFSYYQIQRGEEAIVDLLNRSLLQVIDGAGKDN